MTRFLLHFGLSILLLAAVVALLAFGIGIVGFTGCLFFMLLYGWALYFFFHYRYLRQEELLNVLTAGVENGIPLAPLVLAHVRDRPQDEWHEFWVGLVMFFYLPGYYWFWHRPRSFDRRLEELALRLQSGMTLHQALRSTRGVASGEVVLASAVGEATGQLGPCLRRAPQWRLAPVWLESLPRLVYPVLLLVATAVLTSFLLVFIVPKYEMIFVQLKVRMPRISEELIGGGRWFLRYGPYVLPFGLACIALTTTLLQSAAFLWYAPGVNLLYRAYTRGRLLRMLSLLIEAGKTLPDACDTLSGSGYFAPVVARRIAAARLSIEQGQPLADSLLKQGLLTGAQAPLVRSAQNTGRLSWALAELGENQGRRVVQRIGRLSVSLFPLAVVGVGAVVAFVAFGMFLPLVELINRVGQ